MQHELTKPAPLLDGHGALAETGYAKRPVLSYRRSQVRGIFLREWDSYLVTARNCAIRLTIAEGPVQGLAAVTLLDTQQGWQIDRRQSCLSRAGLPEAMGQGTAGFRGRGMGLLFHNDGVQRLLCVHVDQFYRGKSLDAQIMLTCEPSEILALPTRFHQPGQFRLRQKIHCMRAMGTIRMGGQSYEITPQEAFGTLDWVRGVWPRHGVWLSASASGLVHGVPFGFHLGVGGGLGDATETMLFYGGRAHKLPGAVFHVPRSGAMPWTVIGRGGSYLIEFSPILNKPPASAFGAGSVQVFGQFRGRVPLEGGQMIEFSSIMGVAERTVYH